MVLRYKCTFETSLGSTDESIAQPNNITPFKSFETLRLNVSDAKISVSTVVSVKNLNNCDKKKNWKKCGQMTIIAH